MLQLSSCSKPKHIKNKKTLFLVSGTIDTLNGKDLFIQIQNLTGQQDKCNNMLKTDSGQCLRQ